RLAGDQQLQTGGGGQQVLRDARHLVEQVLGVVEQHEDLQQGDHAGQRFGGVASVGGHAEGSRNGRRDLPWIVSGRQVNEADAVATAPAPAASCRCRRRRRS